MDTKVKASHERVLEACEACESWGLHGRLNRPRNSEPHGFQLKPSSMQAAVSCCRRDMAEAFKTLAMLRCSLYRCICNSWRWFNAVFQPRLCCDRSQEGPMGSVASGSGLPFGAQRCLTKSSLPRDLKRISTWKHLRTDAFLWA